uniref:Cytochrome C oxidase subunit 5B-like protein n=1 Tax=Didymocentrus krausi TaxID=1546215 RepID=A0A3S8V4T3_9SCOR|nr:cytochrome C oxidase subunit 5B-like protein [Didymocentrus krausi]
MSFAASNILRAGSMSSYVLSNSNKSTTKLLEPLELATGLEKKELLAMQSGRDDPFDMRVLKKGPATKDKPTEIPSFLEKSMVGCMCEDDATHINYMWLHKGEPSRCECGYWFKLVEAKPF